MRVETVLSSCRLLAVSVGAAALLTACAVAPVDGALYAPIAPPIAQVETIPMVPYAGAIWINGFWDWDGGRHVWRAGHYEHGRPGYDFHQPTWAHAPDGRWHLDRGGWRPVGHMPRPQRRDWERR